MLPESTRNRIMHKHDTKRHRGGRSQLKNANINLPESVIESIVTLLARFEDKEDFALSYLRKEFLAKFCDESLTPADKRREAAINKWFAIESENERTNARLRGMDRGYNILPRVTFYAFLKFAQQLTEKILGPLSNELVVGSYSGGASTSRKRAEGLSSFKYAGLADVTEGAMPYVGVIHHEVPLFRQHGIMYDLNVVPGAKLFTVPKKTDIDRCACKEPDINMYLQRGVGRHIRRSLLRVGINLNDQSINRKLARQASLDGTMATIDLSSASDTVTCSLVEAILPHDWFLYLNDIRSQHVDVDGTLVQTQMFSSMGNGFTFELESLLFYVLMRTTQYFKGIRGVVSVYGDDLIIPSGMFDDASWVLQIFGFTVNPDKSFSTGLFRESCGGHYYNGEDVTPFYLRRRPASLTDLIRVANQLRCWLVDRDPFRQYIHPEGFQIWRTLVRNVPRDLWGGYDHEIDIQLKAPVYPQRVLRRVVEKRAVPPIGAYLLWHNSNWNRVNEPDEMGHPPTLTVNLCRRRNATFGAPLCDSFFLEELTAFPDPLL